MYRIREVDALDNDIADTLQELNSTVDNFPTLTWTQLENGYWWLAYFGDVPVAFAGLVPSQQWERVGYFVRAGVLPEHRGHGLQRRLMRARAAKAKKLGWTHVVSECTRAPHSANNFIREGFKIYEPQRPWSYAEAIYWIKEL